MTRAARLPAPTLAVAFVVALAFAVPSGAPARAEEIETALPAWADGVVSLLVTYQHWDEDRPWAKQTPDTRRANAVVLDDGRLLTTAQMVDHAVQIQLEIQGRARPVEPRIVLVDRTCNLALLQVDDAAARAEMRPVRLAERTPTSGTVRTVRWRDQQFESAASRIVRVETERAWGSRTEHAFLHMQTDMSGGGWADPVFRGNELIGLAVSQSGQRNRAIPVEILRAFLDRARRAAAGESYVGVPALGVLWQINRDAGVSAYLGQEGEPRGMLIRQIPWGSSGCGVLEPRDLLLSVDGHALDAEGFYDHPRFGKLKIGHDLAVGHRPGDVVPVEVLRDGETLRLDMTLRAYPAELDLIPTRREGQPPYVVAGGLVLRELDLQYLHTWGNDWSKNAPASLLTRYYFDQESQRPDRRRVVLLTVVLPSAYNIGYQGYRDVVIDRVNGRIVGGVADVVEALAAPLDGFHVFELSPDANGGQIVLDAATFDAATAAVLETYGVPQERFVPAEPLPELGGDCPGDF